MEFNVNGKLFLSLFLELRIRMNSKIIIPLFPLGVVLLPETLLPLHIFEERYKEMIGECLAEDKEFGIVYFSGDKINKIGCSAQIVKLLKRYDNGEMDIITVGTNRFLIKELDETRAYFQAKVVLFDDDPEEETEELKQLAISGIKLLKKLKNIMGGEWDEAAFEEESDTKKISFLISGNNGFAPSEKQQFLEMTSTKKRLENGIGALKKVIQRARLSREIQEIIHGNGDAKKIMMAHDIK
jgi:Lon protease-like protein